MAPSGRWFLSVHQRGRQASREQLASQAHGGPAGVGLSPAASCALPPAPDGAPRPPGGGAAPETPASARGHAGTERPQRPLSSPPGDESLPRQMLETAAFQGAGGSAGAGASAAAPLSHPGLLLKTHLRLLHPGGQGTGSDQGPGLLCSSSDQWQEVSGKGISIDSLAHSCDQYLRSPH